MKKHMLLMATMILVLNASLLAQQSRFGIQAGPTMSEISVKSDNFKISSDMKIGFTAGLVLDKPINEHFIFQPAINYVQKGSKTSDGDYKSQITLNYLEVPLNFLYRANASKGFFAGVGPSIGVGISGKTKDDIEETKVEFGNNEDEDDIKTMDFGGNILAGYLFGNGLQVSANYNHTLSNLAVGESADYVKMKNSYFSLRVGYFFNKKK